MVKRPHYGTMTAVKSPTYARPPPPSGLTLIGALHEDTYTRLLTKEFVNSNGFNTNEQEGHWRHMKTSLPIFGTRKEHFSSYLAEFMWRYKRNATRLKFS